MNILAENNQILFQRIQPSDIEQTATCISEVFTNFELITKALKISFAELHGVVLPICKKAVRASTDLVKANGIVSNIAVLSCMKYT